MWYSAGPAYSLSLRAALATDRPDGACDVGYCTQRGVNRQHTFFNCAGGWHVADDTVKEKYMAPRAIICNKYFEFWCVFVRRH